MFKSDRDQWLKTLPIAHRGYFDNKGDAPENTLAAFKIAADKGYAMELDITVTADNQVIAFHDDDLKRLCGKPESLDKVTWDQIKNHTILNSKEKIPLFQEVLDLVNGKTPLLIEIKGLDKSERIEKAVTPLLKKYAGKFAVQSFNPHTVNWFAQNMPEWPRGLISCDFTKDPDLDWAPWRRRWTLSNLPFSLIADHDFVAYHVAEMPHWRTSLTKLTKPVLGWTVRTQQEADRLKPYLDNVIFEKYLP